MTRIMSIADDTLGQLASLFTAKSKLTKPIHKSTRLAFAKASKAKNA